MPPADWHTLDAETALRSLETTGAGLSQQEAAARARRYGPNQMRVAPPIGLWTLLLDQLRSVIVLLLAGAAVLALVLGDRLDALAIAAVLLINTALGFFTELRARRALAALLRIDVARATVVRAGRRQDVDARTLVPGDIIELEAGQQVPADARLLWSTDLEVVEAPLTGESMPCSKDAEARLAASAPLADRVNLVFKATTVAAGRAHAVVVATGVDTEVGRIGGLVSSLPDEKTPLERRLDELGGKLVVLAFAAALLVALVGLLRGLSLEAVLSTAIALAVAAVPESLPAVATITLALGVHRMARRNAIVRRLPSVETLGSVTIICTDKTGTLTAGEVAVTTIWLNDRTLAVEGSGYQPAGRLLEDGAPIDARHDAQLTRALRTAVLANRADLQQVEGEWAGRGDPTEIALLTAGAKAGLSRAQLLEQWPEVGEVPFSSERRWMATIHRADGLQACLKGACPNVLERCTRSALLEGPRPLDAAQRAAVLAADAELAERGLRVLALAAGPVSGSEEDDVHDLEFLGLVGMIDPPADGVRETIDTFRQAGIRTVMITGDQQRTAGAVAGMLGMLQPDDVVLDGGQVDALPDQELLDTLARAAAFSRISPEGKLRLIAAYQAQDEVVAMIGDGINDAAALRKADIGVAMGRRGTDVAREAAALVLQDDRFQTIGVAIRQGRIIFDNIRKFVFYLFSCNLAEVLLLLCAGALGLPLPLLPLQILWLNLVTDTFPALALAVEPGEPDVLHRPPRDPDSSIVSRGFVRLVLLYATLIMAVSFIAFISALNRAPERASTIAFMTLALAQTFHLGTARSTVHVLGRRAFSNRAAFGAVLLVLLLQLLAVYAAPLAALLRTVPLQLSDWFIVLPLAALPALVGQLAHLRTRRRSA